MIPTPNKLEAQALNLYYGDFHALIDVSIAVPPKAITAMIGLRAAGNQPFFGCSTG